MNLREAEMPLLFPVQWGVLGIGSIPFDDVSEGYAWLSEYPFEIAFRPQFPLVTPPGDMFEELKHAPNTVPITAFTIMVKDQIAGPVTIARLSEDPGKFRESFQAHLENLDGYEFPGIFCLDEPYLAIGMGAEDPVEALDLITKSIKTIREKGFFSALHCCSGESMSPLLRAVLSEIKVDLLSLPLNDESEEWFTKRLSRQEGCCFGLSETALAEQSYTLTRFRRMAENAGLSLGDAGKVCCISSECGLGLLGKERARQIVQELFSLSTALRASFAEGEIFSRE